MKFTKKHLLASAIIAGLATPMLAQATNGYFLIGYGSKSRAMGGVGIALAQDGFAAAYNPASMTDVGERFDLGGDFFLPERAIYHNSDLLPANETSHGDFYMIPYMGGVWKLNDEINYGFAFVGAGLGTDYDQYPSKGENYLFRVADNSGNRVGVNLIQMQILPSISYKLNEQHSVGATLVFGAQRFKAEGLGTFETLGYSQGSDNFSDMQWDWSYGAGIRLGWLGSYMNDQLKVGVNYSSKVYMTEFDKYTNLFAESGDFDIPENYGIGIAYEATPDVTVAFDIVHVKYTGIASVSNPGPTPEDPDQFFPPGYSFLGLDNGMGFGWTDQTIYKMGVEYKYSEKITLRTGWNYGESPIEDDQVLFNFLAPATPEHHFTMGGTYNLNENMELSFHYMHALKKTITGKTPFYPEGVSNYSELSQDNAAITMSQNALGATLGIKF